MNLRKMIAFGAILLASLLETSGRADALDLNGACRCRLAAIGASSKSRLVSPLQDKSLSSVQVILT